MSARRSIPTRALWLVALLCASASVGCSPPCQTADTDPVRVSEGNVDDSGTFYESAPWGGPYLYFPGGRRYQLEHHLKRTPTLVNTYLSFDQSGGSSAESAGSQTVIDSVDDEIIQIRNDTCAEFWLRVTAIAPPGPVSDAGVGDAASD
jgi:hypothetical protein